MSNINTARSTVVETTFQGVNVTDSLRPFLKSCSYSESRSEESDDFQILLHDRDDLWVKSWLIDVINAVERSKRTQKNTGFMINGALVQKNWHSDGKDRMLSFGQFQLDEVVAKAPPREITIKGTALPYGIGVQQANKTRKFESVRLNNIAERISKESGMSVIFESAINPLYTRIDQNNISDIVFLQQLCNSAGVSLKVTNNIIVMIDNAAFVAKPAVFDINRTDKAVLGYSVRSASTDDMHEMTVDIKHEGNPVLLSCLTVNLHGWGRWSGKYVIDSTQHSVSGNGGYVTDIKLERT